MAVKLIRESPRTAKVTNSSVYFLINDWMDIATASFTYVEKD